MPAIAVIGLQWGDEGKGKIVDYLSKDVDLAVRFQGGANAGHTVVVNGKVYKFHHLPVAALRGKHVCLAAGMVIDPEKLLEEIEMLASENIFPRITIDGKCHIVFDIYKVLDEVEEESGKGIGTTRRGIGSAYMCKAGRVGIRFYDLLNPSFARNRLEKMLHTISAIIERYDSKREKPELKDIESWIYKVSSKLKDMVGDVTGIVNDALEQGKTILLEGAQGTLLDIDHGTYPYVTSSNTTAGAACSYIGISPKWIKEIVGVAKAYSTRVGKGPFPTEMDEETASIIRDKGKEYGTTTGRPRRIGWFDAVSVRYSARINGITCMALTKVDCLSGIDPVKLCIAYEVNGTIIKDFIPRDDILKECRPVYEELDGWEEFDPSMKSVILRNGYGSLPKNLRIYLERIEELVGSSIKYISIGPERFETIVK